METDSGSKTNETEAQGLDLHLCIICQRKKNENLVEKPEAPEDQLPLYIKKQDFTWLLGRSLTRTITNGEVEDDQPPSTNIPV